MSKVRFIYNNGRTRMMHTRYADVLQNLKCGHYQTADIRPARDEPPPVEGDMALLREQYQRIIGKRPFNGWSAEQLREKIAEAL